MNESKITWLVGDTPSEYKVFEPYAEVVCEFLNDLSRTLLKDKNATQYPDIVSFAYFCRKANILKKKEQFIGDKLRVGRGIVFHIAPSNVPVNFAFSFVFGLLAGNGNIVRVPSKYFPHTEIICKAIEKVFDDEKYAEIKASTAFVKYGHENDITEYFSSIAQARIIWGGDSAISFIKKFPLSHRAIEIAFSDRYSFAVVDVDAVLRADEAEMERLANAFYNDTYLMDQNACSSPQLIVWVKDGIGNDSGNGSDDANSMQWKDAQNKFWKAVASVASKKYQLQPVSAVDKFTKLCSEAIDNRCISSVNRYENILYVADVSELPDDADTLRGTCGYFYQYCCHDLNEVARIVNEKYQTLVYYGVDPSQLSEFVLMNRVRGIDRVVPIGQALDIDVYWDGYDLIGTLSRIVDVR